MSLYYSQCNTFEQYKITFAYKWQLMLRIYTHTFTIYSMIKVGSVIGKYTCVLKYLLENKNRTYSDESAVLWLSFSKSKDKAWISTFLISFDRFIANAENMLKPVKRVKTCCTQFCL